MAAPNALDASMREHEANGNLYNNDASDSRVESGPGGPESASQASFDFEFEEAGSVSTSRHDERQDTLLQADIIAELIQSLQEAELDQATVHSGLSRHYFVEPLEQADLEGITPVAHSGRTSFQSVKLKDSQPPSRPRSVKMISNQENPRKNSSTYEPYATQPCPPTEGPAPNSEPKQPPVNAETAYPSPAKLTLILISLYIAIFLVALDRTIIGPAIPEITNKFHSISDIGWYGSAYMLTSCGFILLYGRVYTFFPTKIVFLSSIALFEIGSAVCGAATSSLILIIGRAIAGFGSSGIFTGAILIILEIVPLHRRPMLQGLFGACFGVASVAGPLLGGAFTGSKATWRWCFYINLPLGGITIGVVLLFLHLKENKKKMSWQDTIRHLDPVGTALFLPSITCLLLALEWGASDYAWSDPRIIALLTVFAILLVAFIAWQAYTRNTTATVPARIAFQRTVAFGGLSQFAVGATMLTVSLYLPLWFQAIKNVSAMQSGIRTIPLVLSVVVGSIFSGGAVQKIGYYTPFMIAGSIFMSVGAGLLTTWNTSIPNGMWIGYQIVLGLGVGFTMQHPNLAIQIVLNKPDIPTGTALLSLCQTLGGAVFTAVGQNTFIGKFLQGLHRIPGVDGQKLVSAGATDIQSLIPEALKPRVLEAYNNSLTQGPFLACLIVACFTLPAALGMEWRSVKEQQGPPPSVQLDEEATKTAQAPESGEGIFDAGEDREVYSLQLPEPRARAWRHSYRMVGDYSWVLVKRLNPDLKDDLGFGGERDK